MGKKKNKREKAGLSGPNAPKKAAKVEALEDCEFKQGVPIRKNARMLESLHHASERQSAVANTFGTGCGKGMPQSHLERTG